MEMETPLFDYSIFLLFCGLRNARKSENLLTTVAVAFPRGQKSLAKALSRAITLAM